MSVVLDKVASVSSLLTQFESAASNFVSARSSFEGVKASVSQAISDLQSEFAAAIVAAAQPPTV